jgi:hypothetical protein
MLVPHSTLRRRTSMPFDRPNVLRHTFGTFAG